MNRRGFSLIELLVALIISTIAFFALAVPFVSERSLWGFGKRQTEAQRDAQVIVRSMARFARESTGYAISGGAGDKQISFTTPCGTVSFQGGPSFNDGQMQRNDGCTLPTGIALLIDGVRSKVVEFTPTPIVTDKLVGVRINISHKTSSSWANEPARNEIIETQIFLRNG